MSPAPIEDVAQTGREDEIPREVPIQGIRRKMPLQVGDFEVDLNGGRGRGDFGTVYTAYMIIIITQSSEEPRAQRSEKPEVLMVQACRDQERKSQEKPLPVPKEVSGRASCVPAQSPDESDGAGPDDLDALKQRQDASVPDGQWGEASRVQRAVASAAVLMLLDGYDEWSEAPGEVAAAKLEKVTRRFVRVAAKRLYLPEYGAKPVNLDAARELLKTWSNHENVARVFDVVAQGRSVWIFTELCSHGDLETYSCNSQRNINAETRLDIVLQTAKAVKYLQSKNIIHGDVKPSNILISSEQPLIVKLTDFGKDLFYHDAYMCDTALTSSNVKSLAFKTPEFFLSCDAGQLQYHRNVDVFALGLTFLALIQARPHSTQLVPQLPCALSGQQGAHMLSIGQVAVLRNFRGQPPLDIGAAVPDPQNWPEGTGDLIHRMTALQPEDRLAAGEVVTQLDLLIRAEQGGCSAAS